MEPRKLTGGDLDVFLEHECPRTQSWLYDTVMGFVDDECNVTVTTSPTDCGAVFHVAVAAGDVGKVIGKTGQMARHLRGILMARARKLGVIYILDIQAGVVPASRAACDGQGNDLLREGIAQIVEAHSPRMARAS